MSRLPATVRLLVGIAGSRRADRERINGQRKRCNDVIPPLRFGVATNLMVGVNL
jgi:hypothetical protein